MNQPSGTIVTKALKALRLSLVPLVSVGLFLALWAVLHSARPSAPSQVLMVEGTAGQMLPASISPPLGSPSPLPRLVEFYAQYCPACERMRPKLEQLRSDCTRNQLEIITVDVSEPGNEKLARAYGVSAVPAVKLLGIDGKVKAELLGEQTLTELRAAAGGLIASVCAGVEGKTQFSPQGVSPACNSPLASGAMLADPAQKMPSQCAQ